MAEWQTFQQDPNWRDLLMFHEYFHGDNGGGIGRQPSNRLDRHRRPPGPALWVGRTRDVLHGPPLPFARPYEAPET